MLSKSQLAIFLSKLKTFEKAKIAKEQYSTDSEIAAEILWFAYMNQDIKDMIIADLGCGTGFLGIATLLLGAKKVYFVDNDENALKICSENLKSIKGNFELIKADVEDFNIKVDLVLQNPPFGTKQKHIDKIFLEKAFSVSNIIYSFHKAETEKFVESISKDYKFKITHFWRFNFPLKQTMKFHKKRIQYIKVGCWRMEKVL